jgi:chromate transporter
MCLEAGRIVFELLSIFLHVALISVTSYSGSAQSLFYEVGVTQLHWVTNQDYTSYLGFGFASPGPQVFSLATFMGYGKAGFMGGLAGTVAIYLAPVVLAIFSGKYLKKWIHKSSAKYFVQAVGIAAAGLLASIGIQIIGSSKISIIYILIAISAAIAINKKVSPLLIITLGLLFGLTIN